MNVRLKPLHVALAAVVVVGLASAVLLHRLQAPSDEELIERLIARTERGVEERDLSTVMQAF